MATYSRICVNPWCKGSYEYNDEIVIVDEEDNNELAKHKQCPKCLSFSNDLSGGVTWVDKKYEGGYYDDGPHEIRYRITNFR